ncbi:MAG TPA: hypothetical protein VL500_05300 [Candidatus Eisenbacteria bacterium]|nr:hypothetical protein [Candidatus Eisenbacteria bacterium]
MRTSSATRLDPMVCDVTLRDLETAAAYLGNLSGAFQPKNWRTCEAFAERVGDALRAGKRLRIIGEGAERMPAHEWWALKLADAPEPWRTRTRSALSKLAQRQGVPPRLDTVEYLT